MKHQITQATQFVRRLLSEPRAGLTGVQRFIRDAMELGLYCGRSLMEDRASQMAAALTYRTIFSLIPFLVLALVVFRAFGGFSDVLSEDPEKWIFDYFEISSLSIQVDPESPLVEGAVPAMDDSQAHQVSIEDIITQLNDKVSQISFTSIGVVGFLLLIWAALALLVAVETSFNYVFACRTGRSWPTRIVVYWSIITLGPVLLVVSILVTGTVMNFTADIPVLGTVMAWVSKFTALLATWLLLMLMYVLVPNTMVQLRAAAIGAFVAALLWEGAKFLLALYVSRAVGYSVLYGSLGLIPLFLFWVYVTWLIVLFGLEITHTLQALSRRDFKHQRQEDRDKLYDPRWLIPIAAAVAHAFEQGHVTRIDDLAREFSLPVRVVTRLVAALEQANVVHLMQGRDLDRQQVALARPAGQIAMADLIELVRTSESTTLVTRGIPGAGVLIRMDQAQRAILGQQTLADVLVEDSPSAT